MDRSKMFHKHESDAVLTIRGAANKFKEGGDPTIITAIEASKKTRKRGRPPMAEEMKTKNTKRVMLYMTEEEYDTFRQYAFDNHSKISDFIIKCAKRGMGRPKKPSAEYIGVDESTENEE